MTSDSRSRFLRCAGYLLAENAVATSALLMYEANQTSTSPIDRAVAQDSCPSCGSIAISTWTSRSEIIGTNQAERSRSMLEEAVTSNQRRSKTVILRRKQLLTSCLLCHRFTRNLLPNRRITQQSGSGGLVTCRRNLATEGKRPVHKKRKGLRTLLEKASTKSTVPTFLQLDLVDLLKR